MKLRSVLDKARVRPEQREMMKLAKLISKPDERPFYDLPGAFDETVTRAIKNKFVNTQIKYPSAFGSSNMRFRD